MENKIKISILLHQNNTTNIRIGMILLDEMLLLSDLRKEITNQLDDKQLSSVLILYL